MQWIVVYCWLVGPTHLCRDDERLFGGRELDFALDGSITRVAANEDSEDDDEVDRSRPPGMINQMLIIPMESIDLKQQAK